MVRGGIRSGAGRPRKYQGNTRTVRLPEAMIDEVMRYVESRGYRMPLYSCAVQAGFPSPADDYLEGAIDLNTHLIHNPAATFLVRVAGDSMKDAGMFDGDVLIVDRSLEARSGKIVIAAVDGQLTVKRLLKQNGRTYLMPENAAYQPIEIGEGNDVVIWGVVKTVLHDV